MKLAEASDNTPLPGDINALKELKRRQNRLVVIAKAKQEIQTRAKARYMQEKAEYEKKLAKLEQHPRETSNKMGGKAQSILRSPSSERSSRFDE